MASKNQIIQAGFIRAACVAYALLGSLTLGASESTTATTEARQSVHLTIYPQNLAHVTERRNVNLGSGEGTLIWKGLPTGLITGSLMANSAGSKSLTFVEQNISGRQLTADQLLKYFEGHEIKLVRFNDWQDRVEETRATLLQSSPSVLYQVGKEVFLDHPGIPVFPELPSGFRNEPQVEWICEAEQAGEYSIDVDYLTGGLSWQADYQLRLDPSNTSASFVAWATVRNDTEVSYDEAHLQLLAGDVNVQGSTQPTLKMMAMERNMAGDATPQEETLSAYHLYTLERTTTLAPQQTKQVLLYSQRTIPVRKEFSVDTQAVYQRRYATKQTLPVRVHVELNNEMEHNLGLPLPKGTARLYQQDSRGLSQFLGSDTVPNVAKDEELRLQLGTAFDVTAERKQLNYQQRTTKMHESEWEICLKNAQEQEATIHLNERIYGNWVVLQSSHPYTKEDASTIKFDVVVPPGERVKVTYSVRIGL